uniref:glucuronosyltransferase n=1 Tax=Panagrolaimus davidi TaxID=227884 RepID=A0A914PPR9_9BILA
MLKALIGGTDVEMGIWGRFQNLYRLWHTDSMNILGLYCGIEKVVQDKIDPKFTTANAIARSSFIFINSEEHLDFPRPITSKIVFIGGFNLDLHHKESEELNALVADAKDGFVFLSFGSVAQSFMMPLKMKQEILKTFQKFPHIKFLWKYENETDKIADGFSNVITKPWFNQQAIFDHPKLICFITHGGMNSLVELSYKGVPAISIPLFADQYRNAHLLKYRKTGLVLTKDKLNAENLSKLISKMIKDKILIIHFYMGNKEPKL